MSDFLKIRALSQALATTLMGRARFGAPGNKTYGGLRDIFGALGYAEVIQPINYRNRYRRGGIAGRLVEARPKSTWRGFGDLVEDDDPKVHTLFEQEWAALNKRLKIWSMFYRLDKLAGIGRYAVMIIGAPGRMDEPLQKANSEDIRYLSVYAEDEATISKFVLDEQDERFALPEMYQLARTNVSGRSSAAAPSIARQVHWTRVIHFADGLLDDPVYGEPRLERPWNLLDDLDKVTGGGAEAFWRRADPGMQIDIDPELELAEGEEAQLKEEVEDYVHGLKRVMQTRGVKVTPLQAAVAAIGPSASAIIDQISATTGIPQRILMGTEEGRLAGAQDRDSWDEDVETRRNEVAFPYIVEPFVSRMIALGALPEPKDYYVQWGQLRTRSESEKKDIALGMASVNQAQQEIVFTTDEIRDYAYGFEPLERENIPPAVAARKEGSDFENIHEAADRFRGAIRARRQAGVLKGAARRRLGRPGAGAR